jgi:hypothetical protein
MAVQLAVMVPVPDPEFELELGGVALIVTAVEVALLPEEGVTVTVPVTSPWSTVRLALAFVSPGQRSMVDVG